MCGCLGGPGEKCKSKSLNLGALGSLAEEGVNANTKYVCLAFASEGRAITDWSEHGFCEMWTSRSDHEFNFRKRRSIDAS